MDESDPYAPLDDRYAEPYVSPTKTKASSDYKQLESPSSVGSPVHTRIQKQRLRLNAERTRALRDSAAARQRIAMTTGSRDSAEYQERLRKFNFDAEELGYSSTSHDNTVEGQIQDYEKQINWAEPLVEKFAADSERATVGTQQWREAIVACAAYTAALTELETMKNRMQEAMEVMDISKLPKKKFAQSTFYETFQFVQRQTNDELLAEYPQSQAGSCCVIM